MLRQDDWIKGQLVLYGWQAGRPFGGHLGSCLIMSILATRQRLGWGSWVEVLESVPKYSATIEQPTGMPNVWEPNFVRLLHEVESIFDSTKDYSKGAVYWADLAKPITNEWFTERILNDRELHPICGNMNSLTFFR